MGRFNWSWRDPSQEKTFMDNPNISKNPISREDKTPEERSKERAAELKAGSEQNRRDLQVSREKQPQIAEDELESLEATIVEELNQTLAIVHTSSTYILIEKGEAEFVLDTKTSLLLLFENQVIPELSRGRITTKAHVWLKSPNRRTFHNIVFNPRIVGHYDGNFNIWKGFAVTAEKGDCALFWDHVKNIICCGKEAHYVYVRKWLAHLIQKPWIIATALVLRGKQGTGKGTFVAAIGKLLGHHYAPLCNLDQILGRFNHHLKNAILIFADEAIWGGSGRKPRATFQHCVVLG
jgi:hypothetical protein